MTRLRTTLAATALAAAGIAAAVTITTGLMFEALAKLDERNGTWS
ncbi:hypothetical protein [Speluncibacter jeojiensis]|nr:hypothetical protein [Rhodococcus sp. D2-41]